MSRIRIKHALIALMAFFTFSSLANADERSKGNIDWSGGYVTAIGQGTSRPTGNRVKDRLAAMRAAEATAQRALLETINGVRIDSVTTVENMAMVEDRIKTRVAGLVKGAQVVRRHSEWVDGATLATVEMRICLSGGTAGCKGPALTNVIDLASSKLPPHVPGDVMALDRPLPQPKPESNAPQPAAGRRNKPAYDPARKVTGVVFNLEGRYFERQMLPVVVTRGEEKLVTVYCVKQVKPDVVRTYGAVRYAESIDHAARMEKLGENPLVIPVADVSRENMIVIYTEDANLLRETMMHGNNYLNDARVVITNK
ncbi:MAG TPA: hypothetical protein PLN25_03670 [Deltaproteobacteria bacterium]|nr:hypothetical protein [Deltaproteobacteria bacterium]HQB38523.1 hypothetical protein [Deltaproteobacteria bacterium]